MKADDMSLPETHIERMDRLQMEHQHKKELQQALADQNVMIAREKRKQERSKTWMGIGIAFAVALVLLGITAAIYYGTKGDPSESEVHHQREVECLNSGGGWVPKDLLDDYIDGAGGLCVYPGKRAQG